MRLDNQKFDKISALMGARKSSRSNRAARLILVEGVPARRAAELTGLTLVGVYKAAQRVREFYGRVADFVEGAQITGQEIDGRLFLSNGRRLSSNA